MSKHTPGPWIIGANPYQILNNSKTGTFAMVALVDDRPQVDGTGCYGFSTDEAKANAALIAAAPELLSALEEIAMRAPREVSREEAADMACEFWNIANDAIKKARGES